MKSLLRLATSATFCSLFAAQALAAPESTQAMQPSPVAVMLEAPNYSFDVNFTALFMKPLANNLDYGAEAFPFNYGDSQAAISPSWSIPRISTEYHFGFDVGVAGVFHDTCSNLMLNWERYHSPNDTNTTTVSSLSNMVGPFFEIGPDGSLYKTSFSEVKFHFDEININYGTNVSFGNRLHTNLFSGVSLVRILEERFTQFSNMAGTIVRTLTAPVKFMGVGPQLGLDFNYRVVDGFQFIGRARASLYVGSFKNSTTYSTTSDLLVTLNDENPNIQTTTPVNKLDMVPGFEAKLGFAYEYLFNEHYMFKLEAGYQTQVYINALRSTDLGSEVALGSQGSIGTAATGVYARTFTRVVSNFSLAGPYVMASFGF